VASVEGALRDPGLLQHHSVAHCQEVSWELSSIQSQREARWHDDAIFISSTTALKVMSSCCLVWSHVTLHWCAQCAVLHLTGTSLRQDSLLLRFYLLPLGSQRNVRIIYLDVVVLQATSAGW